MVEVGHDWVGSPVPPEDSAPLFPEGSRKRHDPRAPSGGGGTIPPLGPPVIDGLFNPDGSYAEDVCGNGLPLFPGRVLLTGVGVPWASVEVFLAEQVAADIVASRQVGAGQADGAGVFRVLLAPLPDGQRCFVVRQSVPGWVGSGLSDPVCCMVGSCVEVGVVPPPIIDGVGPVPVREVCDGVPVTTNRVVFHGSGIRGATVKVYLSGTGFAGSQVATGKVGLDGNWSATASGDFPDGRWCVVSSQTVVGRPESPLSNEFCFHIGECGEPSGPEQMVDFEADRLRFDGVAGWRHGTLARFVDGGWRYGVLRRAVAVQEGGR